MRDESDHRKYNHATLDQTMKSLRTFVLLAVSSLTAAANLPAQPVLQFASASYTTGENAGAVTLTVQRTGDTDAEVSVDFATSDGTATDGVK